jgi:CIC family chloride channel protein
MAGKRSASAWRDELGLVPACLVLGVIVGVVVAGIRVLVYEVMWGHIPTQTSLVGLFPAIGLLLSGLLLQFGCSRPETHDTEAYIGAYHTGDVDRPLTAVLKTLAAIFTVGLGGAAGLEGPSMYIGSALGGWGRPVLARLGIHDQRELRSLIVAGAAAGISAVFKAPLTGLVFALELPYTNDFAREALVPALVASVSAYLSLVSLIGAEPLFPVNRALTPSLQNVLLAAVLGAVLGLVARGFSAALVAAELASERIPVPLWVRTLGGGVVCGILGLVTLRIFGSPLALSSGYEIVNGTMVAKWVGVSALVLFALRSAAVFTTLGSGAAGGTFIPFVSVGAAAGAVFQGVAPKTGVLFPIVGMAAFLSAANATPIAAAVFLAESTGTTGYIIPGIVAATAAYVVGGAKSISRGQRPSRRA